MSGGSGIPGRDWQLTPELIQTLGLVPIAIRFAGLQPGQFAGVEIDYGPIGRTEPASIDEIAEQLADVLGGSPDLSKP